MKPDPKRREEQAQRTAYLIAGYLRQTLSEKEHDELDEWVGASDENQLLFEDLTDPVKLEQGLKEYDAPDTEEALQRIKNKLDFTPAVSGKKHKKARIIRFSIAASVLLLGTLMIFLMKLKNDNTEITESKQEDIQGGGNKATLMLTDGKLIDLSNIKNGLLDSTGQVEILKSADGQLSYEENHYKEAGLNILTTPAGGQYKVVLPDGTIVWLNASSKLKYPVWFSSEERVVELEGEAYFEVAPHPRLGPVPSTGGEGGSKIPFVVKLKNGAQVEVLGTHFNINAYDDEAVMETTLLEGKVMVFGNRADAFGKELKPGEQGKISNEGDVTVVNAADTNASIAWKNGKFQFKDAQIETIMRQVARWYNAEIMYEAKPAFHFNATIYRKEPVSKLLELLESTERVHFSIEGRKIRVRE